ncbi:ADP-heptose:LPS heptosyltransferase [Streptomyces sp. DvalAA-21]|nr:glycosyl transferase family 9 [Streptomyces sp. SirexAA-E]PZX37450.1 ADP-heptose:LPS heptosyltransferase [Streptomyces sp. DvalAA-21]RAJ33857.1 ADP-heptose:LPS heptosyltransferase [Streptomyces sp. DpondAA-E10]RAJ48203.1 ADP-heptose:LPS heptosyltransferase [Streptomyces sp. DpondAA-A50]SCD72042.1 ADP-heptose:LPS heptosyltransferase [Streptomyces sp. DpondAA-F4a]SCM02312.1 ADP-heptose:LPS heptosyltransferase [Streptomyces sp. DpondAA-F4]
MRAVAHLGPAPLPRPTGSRPTVLILRALGLGDLLAGVPALRAVRRAFPGHETVLAAPASLGPAVRATGAVDAHFPTEENGRRVPSLVHWRHAAPDVAVDLHGNGPESHDALAELAPGRLLSYARPEPGHPAPPRWRADEHERHRWCRFLRSHGIPADPGELRIAPPAVPSPAPGAVVLHPGADSGARRWPTGRYAAVAAGLRAAGRRVVVTGGPGEKQLCAEVAEGAGMGGRDVFAGTLTFDQLSALIAGARLFVSGDTGPAHLAFAHGTPSVTLFGPVSPELWGPPPGRCHTALWHPGPPGDPHAAEPDPLLLRLDARRVLERALGALDHGGTTEEVTAHA